MTCPRPLVLNVIFVDDTSVAVSAPSLGEFVDRCQFIMASLVKWCQDNALVMNIAKADLMLFEIRNYVAEPVTL